MDDESIVELYWQRSEQAIPETTARYGNYCHVIAYNILNNLEDSDECVNDTWLNAWNSMPKNRPTRLAPYLGKLTRWLALSRLRDNNSLRRGGGEISLTLDELSESLDSGECVETRVEENELASIVQDFLNSIDETQRTVFIARYWYASSIKEISEKFGFSQSKVSSMLMRTRYALRKHLEVEELC